MRRVQLWMLAAIQIFCSILLLAACSDDDGQTTETEAQQIENVRKSLIGLQVDMSDIMLGGDDIVFWKFKDDGTCELINMSAADVLESDDDAFELETFEGTWEAFANVDNPLDESTEKQNGFRATLTLDGEDRENGKSEKTYYVETVTDENGQPMLLMLSDVAIAYQMMTNYEDGDQEASRTRGFVNDIFEKKKKKQIVVKVASTLKKEFGSKFSTIFGSDRFSGLSEDECKKFYGDANKALNTILTDFKVTSTNYAEWMSEIYTKRGKNPRICDMNIPGSHDTYTYYMRAHNVVSAAWACTQAKPISGQWEAGARVFDLRLRYKEADGNVPEHMELYHKYDAYIDLEKAIQEIVDQLEKHPGETAIASIAFDEDKDDNDTQPKVTNATLKKFAEKGKLVLSPTPDIRLKDCAGKIIVFYSHEFSSTRKDLYGPLCLNSDNQYRKCTLSFMLNNKEENVTITYQNVYQQYGVLGSAYESKSDFWKRKRENYEACFWDYNKFRKTEPVVWSWNQLNAFIGTYVTMSYSQNAEVMHPWAVNFILQNKNLPQGIITMDYIGSNQKWGLYYPNCETLPKVIVETNRYLTVE